MKEVYLHEACDLILKAIEKKLNDSTVPGELLEKANKVILGDRTRNKHDYPSINILPGTASNSHQRGAIREQWLFPIILVAMTHDNNPENGRLLVQELVAKARSVLLKDRRLGLNGIVQDIYSDTYEPSTDWQRDTKNSIFYAMTTINVRFNVCEY